MSTVPKFKSATQAAFKRANPDVKAPKFTWERVSPICNVAIGKGKFRTGRVKVEAKGFRTKVMNCSADISGNNYVNVMVR